MNASSPALDGDLAQDPTDDPDPLPAADAEAWWLRTLAGLRHFELHPDHPRPPEHGGRPELRRVDIDASLVARLTALAERHDVPLATLTLAALLLLLHRCSGETDITIGCRLDDAATASMLLRGDLSGDPGFVTLLQRVAGQQRDGQRHAGVSLARLQRLLALPLDASRNPLYSVHFAASDRADDGRDPLGSTHDLGFTLHGPAGDSQRGWQLACAFNRALYAPATIERLLRQLARLLASIAVQPGQALSVLALLDDRERQALLDTGNDTEADYPWQHTVSALFAAQAARHPEAIALICAGRSLDYRTLAAASEALAAQLRTRGIGPGCRVAVLLERSPDLLVALLAVLASGAAYMPLDPRYPLARLAQIVDDAAPALLLSRQALLPRLPADVGPVLMLDMPMAAAVPDGIGGDAPASAPGPDDIAYLIYTSGSTGRPKGVPIAHRALCNLLWSMRREPGLDATDRLLAVTTVSFDIAALELFLPLIVGATVILAQDQDCADGDALRGLLARHRVTVMQATPVSWQLLLAAGWQAGPGFKMLCGGEALSRPLADRLLEGGGELWNLYGPTETTIWSSALRVGAAREAERALATVPIGPPIANTRFHVLDRDGGLAPPGVPGELYIGGDGLAAGYRNLPDLSRERFIADPFRPGARLYRTGDWVRRREDGSFEFLGRVDRQVKLRGFRIELGDLEAALLAQPGIADGVALIAPDASGSDALLACVVCDPPSPAPGFTDSVQAALRRCLPAYLCPAALIVLAQLPRLPNGKIDRSRLPSQAPAGDVTPALLPMALADDSCELRLRRLWHGLLGPAAIGSDANFFEIGGHSLLAVQLLARIESEFGTRLSLASLFGRPTIAGQLALLAQGDSRAFDFRQVVRLQGSGRRQPLIALNNTGIYYGLSKHLGPDQPLISLQLFDPAQPQAELPQTLGEIARGYAELILRVQPSGPYHLLGWCVAGTLAFEVARQLQAAGHAIGRLILFDTWAPRHLERLPWPRARLADYAFRWQLIRADWRRAQHSERRWRSFIGNRGSVRRLRRWLAGGAPAHNTEPSGSSAALNSQQYDQWLLHYLEAAVDAYQPQPHAGAMLLVRSAQEPSGRFIDPQMGWAALVEAGVTVVVVDGDHFSIFQEPEVQRLARLIEAVLPA